MVTQGRMACSDSASRPAPTRLPRAHPDRAGDIRSALVRLTAADQMGDLFKAIAIHAPDWPAPAGFAVTVSYRDPTTADLPAIDALFRSQLQRYLRASLQAPRTSAVFARLHTRRLAGGSSIDPRYACRLAEADGELCRFRQARAAQRPRGKPRPTGSSFARFTSDKAWHGQGVATASDELGDQRGAGKRGAQELYLTVYVDNHRARRGLRALWLRAGRTLRFHGRQARR